MDALIVGCGLSGAVCARFLAEEMNKKVVILERRSHIGGNMYDYKDEAGILVHRYGPHTFHTTKKELFDFMQRFGDWEEFYLTCGAVINNRFTPTPFNFQTIDDFFSKEDAAEIKSEIQKEYGSRKQVPVLEALQSKSAAVRKYAQFLFDHDYKLYTAKQWGISPEEIDPGVLKRVPLEFSYQNRYFTDEYQYIPKTSYSDFFGNLLNHPNIEVRLNTEALEQLEADTDAGCLKFAGERLDIPVVYTGAIDELLNVKYGKLPYRSLSFEWKTIDTESFQDAPVVAYPQADGYTRITEYTKLPVQNASGKTTIAIEYSIPYEQGKEMEPYYPIPNSENDALYQKYFEELNAIPNLYLCGRLAEYKYYNMDQALEQALKLCGTLKKEIKC